MTYKVLVVDDSSFFQSRLKEIINQHPQLEVVGIAENGQQAVEMARSLKPDVISMDYEMPKMDGVTALRAILAERPVPIVMFSSLTYEGAKTTLEALAAGAVDFIPKNFAEVSRNNDSLKRKLNETLLTFARKAYAETYLREQRKRATDDNNEPYCRSRAPDATFAPPAGFRSSQRSVAAQPGQAQTPRPAAGKGKLGGPFDVVVIGASTGGPVALTEVFAAVPADFPKPIVVVQHMPEHFTRALADRLNQQCALEAVEAGEGMLLKPGCIYVAPGGKQCIFNRGGTLRIVSADERVNYKPSVDVTFASAANIFGARVLAVVLTGMGSDGCEGARLLKQKGATVWGQDQASCVVYGMPKAVAQAELVDDVLPLKDIGRRIAELGDAKG